MSYFEERIDSSVELAITSSLASLRLHYATEAVQSGLYYFSLPYHVDTFAQLPEDARGS